MTARIGIIGTGNINDVTHSQMVGLGIAHCLQKPITMSHLADQVRNALDGWQQISTTTK